ncbi:MAG: TlpA disulfide reductase family protein [Pseudomonadota bacterium]
MRRNIMKGLFALLLATGVAAVSMGAASKRAAPDFTLPSRGGDAVTLSDLKGQVVMINFWATWCGPCRQEMPLLEEMYVRYNRMGFTLLGVNVEEDSRGADAYLKETRVSFPILFDNKNEVSKLYDVIAMPSTVILDKEGTVRYLHKGYKPGYENEYLSQIRTLLKE